MTSDRAPEQGTDLVERLRRRAKQIRANVEYGHAALVQRGYADTPPLTEANFAEAKLDEDAADLITRLRLAAPVWPRVQGLIDALHAAAACNDLSGVAPEDVQAEACNQLHGVEIICRDAIAVEVKERGHTEPHPNLLPRAR